jgi:hypothetical protein
MLYIATVHFKSHKWIDVQLSYLERHLHVPYEVFASLEGISSDQHDRFAFVSASMGNHEGKLNLLAAEIVERAQPDDIILFLDGDAFPIADPMPAVEKALSETPVVAIRRDENERDRQPHPCFCAMRVAEWERLHGDWSPGFTWQGTNGKPTTDVGGNLLGALERTGTPWTPILRTNKRNDHPVWFGVYGDIVYHHGAGFRKPLARVDYAARPTGVRGTDLPLVRPVVARLNVRRLRKWREETEQRNEQLGEQWFELLSRDPNFYLRLTEPHVS